MKRNKMLDFILYHKSTLSGLMAITLILTSIFYTALIFKDANELGIYAAGKKTVSGNSNGAGWGGNGTDTNPYITYPGMTCFTGARAYNSGAGYSYTLTLPSDWGVYKGEHYSIDATSFYWYITPPTGCPEGIYKLMNYRTDGNSTDSNNVYRYIQVGASTTLVWDADTATP